MEMQIFTLLVLIVEFIFVALGFLLFWRKIKEINVKVDQAIGYDRHREPENLESRINNQLNLMANIINSQSTLISSISNQLGRIPAIETNDKKEIPECPNIEKQTPPIEQKAEVEPPGDFDKEGLQHRLTTVDLDKKLDSLLNGTDFTVSIWQHFQAPFDVCAAKLAKYLGEQGIPLPRIEPYPALKDNNPNYWIFMIVQAQNWKDEGRRFVIPRHYDRYDPLWHKHLFEVRGNANKPDSFIKGLVRCAILMNGNLSNNIDKRLVELRGIISVD